MWIIVGLGNPGSEYEDTRHNIGFAVSDEIAGRLGGTFKKSQNYSIAEGFAGTEKIVLVKPATFMNLSGQAVSRVLSFFKLSLENLIVVHDDLDMEVGRLKIKKGGGSGGHKGIESIAASIQGRDFVRIKIGIGKPAGGSTEGYVLGKFRKEEKAAISKAVQKAADAAEEIVRSGLLPAMTRFNSAPANQPDAGL